MRGRKREREFPLIEGRGAGEVRKEEERKERRMATGRQGGRMMGRLASP